MKTLILVLSVLSAAPAFAAHGDVWGMNGGIRQGSCESECLARGTLSTADFAMCVSTCMRIRLGAEADCDGNDVNFCTIDETAEADLSQAR